MEVTRGEEDGRKSVMVALRKAHKSYVNGKSVLQDFNMTVHQGSIYAFLGPSGCGKTTVLSCLAGERVLDSGQITLGVQYKDQIGYMPQNTALSEDLTIEETVNFYRLLFGFTKTFMEQRMREIFSTLDIPPLERKIVTLSGGEQRRVSLCIALLHDPPLLILDEPTVGLDPVLSHRTWEYLHELVRSQNRTVIITTHYVEEAKQADMVGMMRNGVLIVEESPKTLMAEHNTDRLEHVFHRLSQLQDAGNQHMSISEEDVQLYKTKGTITCERKSPIKARQFFSPEHVASHLWKSYTWLKHNKMVGVFYVMLAVMEIVLFGLAFGNNPKYLKVGIVNEELENGRAMDCKIPLKFNCSSPIHSSCWYMEQLEKKKMILVDYEDEESALQASKKNHIWGYLRLGSNYTSALMDRLEYNMKLPPDTVESSFVSVRIDMSNQNIANGLKRDMFVAYLDYLKDIYKVCGWPLKASGLPIEYKPVYGLFNADFSAYGMPAMIILCLFFLPSMLVTGEILNEKQEGVLERNIISGLTFLETLVANIIYCSFFAIVQGVSIFLLVFIVFSIPFEGSIPLLFILSMLCSLCGICFGYFTATISNSLIEAAPLGIGTVFSLTLISGMFWPREAMHIAMRYMSYFLPLTLTIDAVHSISFRGYGVTHPSVYGAFLVLFAWIIIFNIATYLAVRKQFSYKVVSKST